MELPISQIINFLLDNIFFVVIALGILSSIFKRSNRAPEQKHNSPMPTFGGNNEPKGLKDVFQQLEEVFAETKKEVEPKPVRTSFESTAPVRSESYTNAQELPKSRPTQVELTVPVKKGNSEFRTHKPLPKRITKNKVAQGIIFAEILGPPRAKKPFHRL